jgi:phosphatidylserine decarboxylase
MDPIRFINRDTGETETEQVYGEGWLRFFYGNPVGKASLHLLLKRRVFSSWFGYRMDRPGSAAKIAPFIRDYGLDPEEFAAPPESFRTFNEFFFRKLRPEARPVDPTPGSVVFPADGRHLGFQRADRIDSVFVKNQRFDLAGLLGDSELAGRFAEGSLILSRLCPTDYHRFHFPVAGVPGPARESAGPLFSVSPLALRRNLSILWENKRTLTRIETEDIGTVLMLEIGAACVGTIRQTYQPGRPAAKGAEKGYFAFGGSSVITLSEPGRVRLAEDLLDATAARTELYARMGTRAC